MEKNRLVCRWFEAGERGQYNPRWMQDAPKNVNTEKTSASGPDFARLSPFGGKWYVPDRQR
jgi:hypothetical protein